MRKGLRALACILPGGEKLLPGANGGAQGCDSTFHALKEFRVPFVWLKEVIPGFKGPVQRRLAPGIDSVHIRAGVQENRNRLRASNWHFCRKVQRSPPMFVNRANVRAGSQ